MASRRRVSDWINQRETYRYFDPSDHLIYNNAGGDVPLPPARQTSDPALEAFVQLTVLRLRTSRGYISIFDESYQYIIAEATGPPALINDLGNHPREDLILCGIAFPHDQGIAAHIVDVATRGRTSPADESLSSSKPELVVVIPNVQEDERFKSRSIVAKHGNVRFYAGVPIRTSAGLVIGVISVADNQPRDHLNDAEADVMRHMSGTIMSHLDNLRSRREDSRGKRMVRGLGSFVENRATMAGLGLDPSVSTQGSAFVPEGALNSLQQDKLRTDEEDEKEKEKEDEKEKEKKAKRRRDGAESKRGELSTTPQTSFSPFTQSPRLSLPKPLHSVRSDGHVGKREPRSPSPPISLGSSRPNPGSPGVSVETERSMSFPAMQTHTGTASHEDLRQLFSKAANIIRESIQVEAVLFFDAAFETYQATSETNRHSSSDSNSVEDRPSSSSREDIADSGKKAATDESESMCSILAFSMTHSSSIDGDTLGRRDLAIPKRFLRLLWRRYPEGKIFNFGESGILLSETESEEESTGRSNPAELQSAPKDHRTASDPYTRTNEASMINNLFPGARSIMTFPLWDSHRERWFAGGIAWTHSPTRVFSVKAELSYLRAFGATIMAEVAKLNAQRADKAKGDVLSTLSHELRSPLHGILGGMELLRDTEMDVFQNSIMYSVERCGVTLLDTIDHLLDHAKINNLTRVDNVRRKQQRRDGIAKSSGTREVLDATGESTNIDVDAVVEEVIETVTAGFEFQINNSRSVELGNEGLTSPRSTVQSFDSNVLDTQSSSMMHQETRLEDVNIIFDISPAVRWAFDIQAGALRRIVMNLFGNAIKYTAAGHVIVAVTQEALPQSKRPESKITIKVQDTGKGISAEYLSNHIFQAFSQEDSFSPGTGLGLSITRQIVTSLGGNIDVKSAVGEGTTVAVALILADAPPNDQSRDRERFIHQTEQTKGLRAAFLGFDADKHASMPKSPGATPVSKDWRLTRLTVEKHCRDWLLMDVVSAGAYAMRPDIYFSTLEGVNALPETREVDAGAQPVIVICATAAIARHLSTSYTLSKPDRIIEYVSQPCGPRKLARTVTLCLNRWTDRQVKDAIRDQSFLPTLPTPQDTRPTEQPPYSMESQPRQMSFSTATTPHESMPETSPVSSPITTSTHTLEPQHIVADHRSTSTHPPKSPVASPTNIAPYLLVDDNDINLNLLSAYMRKRKLRFTTATDGSLAVAAYKKTRGNFCCILMDIQMPRMDGLEATRQIREYERQEGLAPTTIIAMTGLATVQTRTEAEACGMNEFFAKPVKLKALDSVLEGNQKVSETVSEGQPTSTPDV